VTQECAQDRVYEGRIDQELLKRLITEKLGTLFYTSGPPSFVEDLSASDFLPALEGRGFPPKGFIVPTSVRSYIPHLAGSRVAQRTTPI